jgi:fatty acid desaturase
MISVGQELAGLEMSSLTEINSIHFKLKLVIFVALTTGFISLTIMAGPFLWVFPAVLVGLMYAHAIELQHQCLHNTAFRNRPWNRRVGVLLGVPLLVSFSDYQHSHMRHHKLLGTSNDQEFFNYNYEALTSFRALIPHLFMVGHYPGVLANIARSVIGTFTKHEASPRTIRRIRNEYRIMAVFLVAMAAVSIGFETTLFLKIWLIPFFIGVPTHALIELPEHIGCDIHKPNVLSNTRTIKASWLGVWFTDGNNYHVEHHWLPGVPNDKFPQLYRLIQPYGAEHVESSYWAFYSDFMKRLYRNEFARQRRRAVRPAHSRVYPYARR